MLAVTLVTAITR